MKKIYVLAIALAATLSFTACDGTKANNDSHTDKVESALSNGLDSIKSGAKMAVETTNKAVNENAEELKNETEQTIEE
ncbi:MAG TPA: hypothetical protein DIT04_12120, partial [Dysgonomonas sp.]|nr:hypothetical protein [Dysgonomonas sp.]